MSQIVNDEIVQTPPELSHLSDEQFAGMICGAVAPEVRSHLEVCSLCAAEAEQVSSAIGGFERDSRLWAERRAAATPVAYPVRQPIPAWLQVPAAWAVAAVAMVIATTVGLPHFGDRSASVISNAAMISTASSAPEVAAATLKSDNELLSAIDVKLSANDTPPAQFYGLQEDEHATQSSSPHEVSD